MIAIKNKISRISDFLKNNNENFLVFLVLTSLLIAFFFIFYKHSIHADYWITGHDEDNFLARSVFFHQSILAGDWIPQWSSGMRAGFGSPFHLFYGKWSFYLAEFFKFLQLSDTNSWIAVCIFSYWISGLGMYLFLRLYVSKIASLAGMIIFSFFPFHLSEVLVRTDPAQALAAYGFITFAFYFGVKFIRDKKISAWIFAVIFGMLSLTTHTLSGAMWFPVLALFLLYTWYQEKAGWPIFWSLILAGFCSVTLSGFYILPLIFSQDLVNIDLLFEGEYTKPIKHIYENLLSPEYLNSWTATYNTDQLYSMHPGRDGHFVLNLPLGIGILLIALASIPYLFSKKIPKKSRNLLQFFSILFVLATFLNTSKYAEIIWNLDFMHVFQFAWRITPWIVFSASVMGAIVAQTLVSKKSGNIGLLMSFFALIWIAAYPIMKDSVWITSDSHRYDRVHYPLRGLAERVSPQENKGFLGTAGEYVPKTVSYEFDRHPNGKVKALEAADWTKFHAERPDDIKINKYWRDGNKFTFKLTSQTIQQVYFDQIYFPGWKAYTLNPSNKFIKQEIKLSPNKDGLIQFQMPLNWVEFDLILVFEKSLVSKIGNWISIFTILLMILGIYFRKKINRWLGK